METISTQVRQELTGTLYPQALLDRVVQLRDQHREERR